MLVGKRSVIRQTLVALLAGGHLLIEDVLGTGKTTLARTLAEVMGVAFNRIQFTPDLLPADIMGTVIYEQKTGNFSVKKGPVFSNLVLADEADTRIMSRDFMEILAKELPKTGGNGR